MTSSSQLKNSTPAQEGTLAPEIIRALTPIFIAFIGGAIGITVIFTGNNETGFGVASTALAGAAGLAQPGKETDKKPPQAQIESKSESS